MQHVLGGHRGVVVRHVRLIVLPWKGVNYAQERIRSLPKENITFRCRDGRDRRLLSDAVVPATHFVEYVVDEGRELLRTVSSEFLTTLRKEIVVIVHNEFSLPDSVWRRMSD